MVFKSSYYGVSEGKKIAFRNTTASFNLVVLFDCIELNVPLNVGDPTAPPEAQFFSEGTNEIKIMSIFISKPLLSEFLNRCRGALIYSETWALSL